MTARPPPSLSGRLVLGALAWIAVMLAAGGVVLSMAFRDKVEQEFANRLEAMLRSMIAATEIAPDGRAKLVRPLGDPRFDQVFSGWYWQVSGPDGRPLRSRSLWDSAIDTVDGGDEPHRRWVTGPRGERLMVVERDLAFPDAAGPVHLLIAADTTEMAEGVRRFDLLLLSALGLMGAGMAVAILIQVGFGLRPLRVMAADLLAVRRGERPRLGQGYPREVAPLAEAMNAVLARDEELIERARTHVGNLAHGLKTPLAVIAAEMAGSPDKAVVADQLQSMRRLVERHLGRASAEAGAGRTMGASVPVAETARAIAGALSRLHGERGIVLHHADIPPDLAFPGHGEDLEEILGNLMENACKYAARLVRVSARGEPGELVLAVEDDGPGLTAEQAAEASRRGRRLDEMAPGWGLGLAIVADIVQVYGGSLAFGRSQLGGLMVEVRLPDR